MENKKLNEKESLELISQMIQNTRTRVEKDGGTPFLIWGYGTVIISLEKFNTSWLIANANKKIMNTAKVIDKTVFLISFHKSIILHLQKVLLLLRCAKDKTYTHLQYSAHNFLHQE